MESPGGFARYVGRVGALAVALGIGAAVATSPGVAVAEPDTTGSTQSSTTSESTDSQQDSAAANTPAPTPASGSDASDTVKSSATVASDPRDGTVQASGGANTTVASDATLSTADAGTQAKTSTETAKTAKRSGSTDAEAAQTTRPTSTVSADTVTSISTAAPAANSTQSASTSAQLTAPAPRFVTTTALISPVSGSATAVLAPTDPITAAAHRVVSLAAGLASLVGLSPALTDQPLAPAEPPTLWVMLAWVRRQFEETLFNRSPQVGFGPVTTSQSETGVVTGVISTADAEQDPLTMRVVTGPANGTVTVDPHTGGFVYTPDEGLGASGGVDTFTVAVSELNAHAHWHADGVGTTTATVLVSVLPAGAREANDEVLDAAELVRLVADGKASLNANNDGTVRAIDGTFTHTIVGDNAGAALAMNYVAGLLGAPAGFASGTNITSQALQLGDAGAPTEVIYRLQPTVDGVPTLASQVVLVTDENGTVTGVFSSYRKGITDVDTTSTVDDDTVAMAAARAALADSLAAQGDDSTEVAAILAEVAMQSERVIYDVDPAVAPSLAHRITVYTTVIPTDAEATMPVISTTYYVYANGENAGDVFAANSNLADASTAWVTTTKTATDLKSKSRTITVQYQQSSNSYRFNDVTRSVSTYAASSTSSAPGTLVTKAWWAGWNKSAVSAHANTEVVYDYYRNNLGRMAFDGIGSALRVSTLPNTYNNAYWDPSLKILVFGHDFEAALDVVGHEYTHGVVQYAVANGNGLIYQGESGALNESYADIIGSLIENKTGTGRWLIAEDYGCGKWSGCAIRDMSNPAKYGQPTNYANRYTGTADYGGVHTNSGIFNFAAYKMMTDSRTSTVSSATWAAVFYGSLYKLPTNATFADGRSAVLNTAKDLGFTTTQQQAITDAFNAVGVT
ncbi:Zn-dependent metalloprotease [Mycobacterium sp. OAS707]|uniref:M4 family metallopeptidase n=1 Tax=Mycobacterium sp. OAS707 TaxID=2663822 RepID=UPI0017890A6F|nr:M4 family metallopeptidase [Mycobacterium sp. OAS707]MBE1551448.1 Zn-dependent metalloprotease [Mycobacterium sp. OAS707]